MRPQNDILLYLYLVSQMQKGGHNIATKSHDTVLWVIFAVFFMKRQDIYNGMILAQPRNTN